MEAADLIGGLLGELARALPFVLGSLVVAGLYAAALWKAGFRGAVLGLSGAPIVVMLIGQLLISGGGYFGAATQALFFVLQLVSLIPLFVLVFATWPRLAAPGSQGARP